MSDDNRMIYDPDGRSDEAGSEPRSNAIIRSLPLVTFGLRAAALAGMVISAGSLAAGLAGIADGGPTNDLTITTCCLK